MRGGEKRGRREKISFISSFTQVGRNALRRFPRGFDTLTRSGQLTFDRRHNLTYPPFPEKSRDPEIAGTPSRSGKQVPFLDGPTQKSDIDISD